MASLLVNGVTIDAERIQRETAAVAELLTREMAGEDPVTLRIRAREWAEENLIEDELLRQAAIADPEPVDPAALAEGMSEEQFRRDRLMARITEKAPKPTKAELKAAFQANSDAFFSPEVVHVAHIVRNVDAKNDEASAREAIERAEVELSKGRAFGKVADELSDCAGNGGDLGFFPRGQMVESFDDVVFGLRVGQVSGIFRTEFGFHIAKLLERIPEGIPPFEKVKDTVEQALMTERKQAAMHEFLDGMLAKAEVRRVGEGA